MNDDRKHTNQLADLPQEGKIAFGQRLKALRTQASLSQERVAAAVGVTRSMVSQWEGGIYPGGEYVVALAEVLEIDVAELLVGRPAAVGTRQADPILVAKAMVARVVRKALDDVLASIESTDAAILRAAGESPRDQRSKGRGRRR